MEHQIDILAGSKLSEGIRGFSVILSPKQKKHSKKILGDPRLIQAKKIQSINWENPAFFDPSFWCYFHSQHTISSEAVFLWA